MTLSKAKALMGDLDIETSGLTEQELLNFEVFCKDHDYYDPDEVPMHYPTVQDFLGLARLAVTAPTKLRLEALGAALTDMADRMGIPAEDVREACEKWREILPSEGVRE